MEKSPVILALDTSLGPCSAAVLSEGRIRAQREESTNSQSRVLIPMIEAVLEDAHLTYADCTAIACTIGPGGFTGIRVGLASARAIALASGKPLIGLTTLEVIAFGAQLASDVVAVVDAHRGQFYAQRFRLNGTLNALSEPLLVEEASLKAVAHGAKSVQAAPAAPHVALLAAHKWQRGMRDFPTDPLYIREPDAKLPSTQSA